LLASFLAGVGLTGLLMHVRRRSLRHAVATIPLGANVVHDL